MLISARKADGRINTMTASWGGFGIMWGRAVCLCVIRPQRYTLEFVNEAERLTLTFLKEGYREALTLCGRKSGRDCDKIAEAGLTPVVDGDLVGFEEARMVIAGRKLYCGTFREEGFLDRSIVAEQYPKGDFHRVFVCGIEDVLIR